MDCKQRECIDLHVHSNASDGSHSATEILALADRLNLAAVAITDHDSVDGCKIVQHSDIPKNLQFLPGVEISAGHPPSFPGGGSFHILGYGIRLADGDLNRSLEKLQTARRQRNPRIVEQLEKMGMPIRYEDLLAKTGENGQVGRPHIAAALVENGYVNSIDEAFDRFLGKGKPAYVDKYRIACGPAIEIIIGAGGIPVLAHPGLLPERHLQSFDALLRELKEMGMMGIEAFYPEHSRQQTERFIEAARRYELLMTGGTDFHGALKPEIQMGFGTGDFKVPYAVFEKLIARLA